MNKIATFVSLTLIFTLATLSGQNNLVTYAGGPGKETFYDVLQITDGSFLVSGYAEDLSWVNANVPRIQLSGIGGIPNAQGANRHGILLHLSSDLQQILHVVYFPKGVVEDIRFIKTNARPITDLMDAATRISKIRKYVQPDHAP